MNASVQRSARSFVIPTIATLAGLAITIAACIWQYGRGVEKDGVAARIIVANAGAEISVPREVVTAGGWLYRKVKVRGEFVSETLFYHDNQVHDKRVGYNVYTVFRIAGSATHCLVKRGWIAANPERSNLPEVRSQSGEIEVTGLALPPTSRFLELSASETGRVWQNVTVDRAAKAFNLTMQPFVIEQQSAVDDGLVRQWDLPQNTSAKHYGYAFQWAGMATLIAILYGYFYVRRKQR